MTNRSSMRRLIAPCVLAAACLVSGWGDSRLLATDPPPKRPEINEDYALKFYQENLPEIYDTIILVRSKDPSAYARNFRDRMIQETRRLTDMNRDRPKLFEPSVREARLSFRSTELGKQLRAPETLSPEELVAKGQELPKVLSELFDVRAKIRDLQLDAWREQLEIQIKQNEAERAKHDEYVKKKDEVVQGQLNDLLHPKPK